MTAIGFFQRSWIEIILKQKKEENEKLLKNIKEEKNSENKNEQDHSL